MPVLDDIKFNPDPDEVFARLHLNARAPYAAEIHALIEDAKQCARPRALYKVARADDGGADAVVLTETCPPASDRADAQTVSRACFVSRALHLNLQTVREVFPFVTTCGCELDNIPIARDDVFSQYCHDMLKEMALRTAFAHLSSYLKETHGLKSLACMSPGAGDLTVWPIEQQTELFEFLGNATAQIGVTLTKTCMMLPNKTVSGLFYPCDAGFESCQLCRREECHYRRAAFDPHLWGKLADG